MRNRVLTSATVVLGLLALLWVWFSFLQLSYLIGLGSKPETIPLLDLLTYMLGLVSIVRCMFELATLYKDEDRDPRARPPAFRPRPAQNHPYSRPPWPGHVQGAAMRQFHPPLGASPREEPVALLPVETEHKQEGK